MRHEGLAGGPIGMPSALPFPVAQNRLHEDPRSQLRFQQPEGVPVQIGDTLPESPPLPLWEGRFEWNGDTALN
jgi:hypothetical protein